MIELSLSSEKKYPPLRLCISRLRLQSSSSTAWNGPSKSVPSWESPASFPSLPSAPANISQQRRGKEESAGGGLLNTDLNNSVGATFLEISPPRRWKKPVA